MYTTLIYQQILFQNTFEILFSNSITSYKQILIKQCRKSVWSTLHYSKKLLLMLLMHFHIINDYFNRYFCKLYQIIKSQAPMIEDQKQAFQIKVTTWNRDLKGLFDYHAPSDQLKVSKFNLNNHCKIFRDSINNENYFIRCRTRHVNSNAIFVGKLDIQKNQNKFFSLKVQPKTQIQIGQNPSNSPYLVLKSNLANDQQYEGYHLKFGDKIKIGYIQYTIIEMKTDFNRLQSLQKYQGLMVDSKENSLQINFKDDGQEGQKTSTIRRKRRSDLNRDQNDKETTRKTLKNKKIKKKQSSIKKQTPSTKNFAYEKDSQQESEIQKERDLQNQLLQDEQTVKFCSLRQKRKQKTKKLSQNGEQKTCKICLLSQQTNEDPFISACFCKGSCSLTHLGCLKSWIYSQTQVQSNKGVKSYHLKRSSCQICKCPFPRFIYIRKQKIYLLDLELPTNSYMVLQVTEPKEINKDDKKYIVIDGEKNPIVKIGRNNDAQIRIKDITVSRKHAQIMFKNNQFYIVDTHSKFGTLLKIQNDLKFGDQEVRVQMGRCLFSFKPLFKKPTLEELNQSDNI